MSANISRSQTRLVDKHAWEEHFQRMAGDSGGGSKAFYKVKTKTKEPTPISESVRLVSETASSLAQAKGQVASETQMLQYEPTLKDLRTKRKPPLKRKNRLVTAHNDDIFSGS